MALSRRVLRAEGAEQLRALSRDLRRLEDGAQIRRDLSAALREVMREMTRAEKAAVLGLPSSGESVRRGRRPLRQAIAAATQAQVRTSGKSVTVGVRINPRMLRGGRHNLPAYMNREKGYERWRHPVFGNTDVWRQQPATPWFYRTAQPFVADAGRRIDEVIAKVANEIERG